MATPWLVVIPAWGDLCVGQFKSVTMPAIEAALARIDISQVRFLAYTDQPEAMSAVLAKHQNTIKEKPNGKNDHYTLGMVHNDALRGSKPGEIVLIINADTVPSIEVFERTHELLSDQSPTKLIMMAATRTWSESGPPIGASSRDLLEWTWANRHAWIDDCVWGRGQTEDNAQVIFESDNSVVLHAFHLHPFAVKNDGRDCTFNDPTIDGDLLMRFKHEEVHVVTGRDEMALSEMSPQQTRFRSGGRPYTVRTVVEWASHKYSKQKGRLRCNAMHRWLFKHQIRIVGDAPIDQRAVVDEVLREMT